PYPYLAECGIPTKLTATQLKGREKDQEIAQGTVPPYSRPSFDRPKFLAGDRPLTADQRGTATHLVMQYLPLEERGTAAVRRTVDSLRDRRLLTEEQAASINAGAIARFLDSPLAEELRQAKEIRREFRFSLLVPAGDYYPEATAGDELLLQGVVDLYAQVEGGILVVDFKTDFVTEETVRQRSELYRPQLLAYSRALESILEQPVVRRLLYFFQTGESIEV
ncbi:MAG: PD-(D/E)XK nuclease family protein, partial [Oscillospiraceae bacterium]|nr:PD-(D/E)XK nuclease family protein [Oscillospiraceae bacterium]